MTKTKLCLRVWFVILVCVVSIVTVTLHLLLISRSRANLEETGRSFMSSLNYTVPEPVFQSNIARNMLREEAVDAVRSSKDRSEVKRGNIHEQERVSPSKQTQRLQGLQKRTSQNGAKSLRARVQQESQPQSEQQEEQKHQGMGLDSQNYNLTAVVMFRVNFNNDLLKFSHEEIDQWMTYLEYAGVQHFYMYDNCLDPTECVTHRYANDSRVTYTYWPVQDYVKAQNPAYEHHRINHPKSMFEFQADIDEYPFMKDDQEPGFLMRFAQNMSVDQTLIQTWFYGGPSETNETWRVLRYFHRQEKPITNGRQKPLYRSANITKLSVHQAQGPMTTATVDPSIMHLKHYWCERLEEKQSVFDDSIEPLIEKVLAWQLRLPSEARQS